MHTVAKAICRGSGWLLVNNRRFDVGEHWFEESEVYNLCALIEKRE